MFINPLKSKTHAVTAKSCCTRVRAAVANTAGHFTWRRSLPEQQNHRYVLACFYHCRI